MKVLRNILLCLVGLAVCSALVATVALHAQAAPVAAPIIAPQLAPLPMKSASDADVIKGKVTLSYNKYCSTKNGNIYVKVSKKAERYTAMCMGRVWTDMYGFVMSTTFIINKNSAKGSTARANITLQLSPKKTKKWKHSSVTATPFAVGWNYFGGSKHTVYSSFQQFKNLATKNTRLHGEFKISYTNSDSDVTNVFWAEFAPKIYYSAAA